jgi:chromosome segregation ATPase
MDHGFEVLEEKVRRAADLLTRLRKENKVLEEDLGKAKGRLQEAERRLTSLEKERSPAGAHEVENMSDELKTLRRERDEIRARIAKLVEVLDILD